MKCKVCDKELKQITNTHLKTHNLTPKEYKERYKVKRLRVIKHTKGEWDENLQKYKFIKHSNRKKVTCRLCGNQYYRISQTHMQRKHQIDLADYKDMYPNEPLFITTDKERKLISKNHADVTGKNNSQWLGGLNDYKYTPDWRKIRKLAIEYYGDICYRCGSKNHICIHHIDYNKKNNRLGNLIPLCLKCHLKTNFNREFWERIISVGLSGPSLNNNFHRYMNKHVDDLSKERENEIEDKLLC
jgi:ribosomal protein L28